MAPKVGEILAPRGQTQDSQAYKGDCKVGTLRDDSQPVNQVEVIAMARLAEKGNLLNKVPVTANILFRAQENVAKASEFLVLAVRIRGLPLGTIGVAAVADVEMVRTNYGFFNSERRTAREIGRKSPGPSRRIGIDIPAYRRTTRYLRKATAPCALQ